MSVNYLDLDINCHGGLTFMSPTHRLKDLLKTACNDMWIGFDCGHAWDRCDTDAFRKYYGEEQYKEKESFFNAVNSCDTSLKDFHYVEKECQSIIEQLIEKAE